MNPLFRNWFIPSVIHWGPRSTRHCLLLPLCRLLIINTFGNCSTFSWISVINETNTEPPCLLPPLLLLSSLSSVSTCLASSSAVSLFTLATTWNQQRKLNIYDIKSSRRSFLMNGRADMAILIYMNYQNELLQWRCVSVVVCYRNSTTFRGVSVELKRAAQRRGHLVSGMVFREMLLFTRRQNSCSLLGNLRREKPICGARGRGFEIKPHSPYSLCLYSIYNVFF